MEALSVFEVKLPEPKISCIKVRIRYSETCYPIRARVHHYPKVINMTDNVNSKQEILEKYREAGRILKIVRIEAVEMIRVGNSLLKVAELVENRTIELGGRPAFPCNISRNEEAPHATPKAGDTDVFERDMVKLDLGVHVDGYIADSAVTFDL